MQRIDRLRTVFQRDRSSVCAQFSEWFYTYHADLYVHGVPFDVYVEKVAAIRRLLGKAQRVLDLGAGFGVYSCLLRLMGIPQVVSLDYHGQKAHDARTLVQHVGLDGITVLQGDALALPFRQGSFDAAIALACLSHIREPEQAIRNLAVLLKPGGRLYVFEDNNSTFPGYERAMSRVWEGAETGRYEDQVPSEKQRAESYIEIRREMIRDRFPGLSAEAIDHCARATRGLYGRQIAAAVEEFRSRGAIRNPRRRFVCHPLSGEYEEYPLNTGIVKSMLRQAGFTSSLKSPHTGPFSGRLRLAKRVAAAVFSAWPELLARGSPTFAVSAVLRPDR